MLDIKLNARETIARTSSQIIISVMYFSIIKIDGIFYFLQVVHFVVVEESLESEHASLNEVRSVIDILLLYYLCWLSIIGNCLKSTSACFAGSRFLCFG